MGELLKISGRQLLALHKGLNSLDAVREGEKEIIGFEFDRKVAWAITKNAVIVERAKEVLDRHERTLMKKHGVFDGLTQNEANGRLVAAFNEEFEAAKDEMVDLPGILYIKLDELINRPETADRNARRTNPIPASVLRNLAPIINES